MAQASAKKPMTMDKRKSLKKMFDTLDIDGDGVITAAELATSVKNSGKEPDTNEILELIATADKDGDRQINFVEFLELMASDDEDSDDEEDADEQLREIFKVYDKDGTGTITVQEIKGLFESQGMTLDDKTKKQFEELDRDGDGTVTFEEFKKLVNQ